VDSVSPHPEKPKKKKTTEGEMYVYGRSLFRRKLSLKGNKKIIRHDDDDDDVNDKSHQGL
jgi:hypothetical protein